jgi:cobalt-zinc-cadmium efflux system outer membrane protein
MLDLEGESMNAARRAMLVELNGMLGRPVDDPLTISGTLPDVPGSETLQAVAQHAIEQRRPDFRMAELEIDRARSEEALARAERWEDVGVGLAAMRQRQTFDGQIGNMTNSMVGIAVTIPLPLWNRNQGRIAEAQAMRQRALAGLEAKQLAIATEIREAETRMTGLAVVLGKTRGPAVELARENTKLLEETYASGGTPFLMIIESQKQRLDLEKSALQTEDQLAAAISAWEMRTGYFAPSIREVLAAGRSRTGRVPEDKVIQHPNPPHP